MDGKDNETAAWWPAGEVGQALRPTSSVVPVLGAGIGVMSGVQLARWMSQEFPSSRGSFRHPGDLFKVVDEIDRTSVSTDALRQAVATRISEEPVVPTSFTRAIVRVPSKLLLTFNYDDTLEESMKAEGMSEGSFDVYTHVELASVRDLVAGGLHRPCIVHLHGSVHRPETLVLDAVGYRSLSRDPSLDELLVLVLLQKTLCFIGTKLDEIYFLSHMERLGSPRRHVLLCPIAEADELTAGRAGLSTERHGILVGPFERTEQLAGFAAALSVEPRTPVPQGLALPVVRELEEWPYVANVLGERSRDGIATDERLSTTKYLPSQSGQRALSERDIAASDRVLIVGAPGSGKTELLRHAAGFVRPDVEPILIRLPSLRSEPGGDPGALLVRWAQGGEAFRDGTAVTMEALQHKRFHFFFDGLDEVVVARHAALVSLLAEVGRAFPQHAFTVASRPIEAVGNFAAADWRIVDVEPDMAWQQRYLAEVGVSLAEMELAMPALLDLRDLLSLPFFLARVVRVYKGGRLQALPDLWALLQELITEAIEREEAALPLRPTDARGWLQRLALAMTLAGKTMLTRDEVREIPLPSNLVGSSEEITSAMVARLMLQDQPGGFSFIHRIIGESLAAEALADIAPTDEILDAIVPIHSDAIRGTRSDWLVPLAFLLPRNELWRETVRARDELQAARCTPPTASLEERTTAASLIWNNYVRWQIWIWDRERPDLIDDAQALGRLLRAAGMDDFAEEIRSAMHNSNSDQVQGNAIRVLALSNTSLVDDLRRVLEDDTRAPVVRRQAAIAARDLKLVELLPLIVWRAANPADSAEAQDCSLAAMNLAPDDAVLETALQLVKNRDSRMIAAGYAQRRLDARGVLSFLHAFAATGEEPLSTDRERFRAAAAELMNDPIDASTAGDVAFIAAVWHESATKIKDLIRAEPRASLAGINEAFNADLAHPWYAQALLDCFSLEDMEASGIAEDFVDAKRREIEWADPEKRAEAEAVLAKIAAERQRPVPEQPLTLSELLKLPRETGDHAVGYYAHGYASHVKGLTNAEADDLRGRLRKWWPAKPFEQTITWQGPHSWSQESSAAAWIWYGPPLDMELSDDRWAQIAVCGILFEEQFEWLRRQSTDTAKELVADACNSPQARIWAQAMTSMPGAVPERVVEAMLNHVQVAEETAYDVTRIGERLAAEGHLDAVYRLASLSPAFGAALRPLLAAEGDAGIQRELLQQLQHELASGHYVDRSDVGWLHKITDVSLLSALLGVLEQSYSLDDLSEDDRRSVFVAVDVGTPVINAIRSIGGPEAMNGLDELMARRPDLPFLRLQREAVVRAMLQEDGLRSSPQAAAAAGVPSLLSEESDTA